MPPSSTSEISSIYDTAPVGLCLISTDLRFLRVNQAMALMNGISVEGHLGQRVTDILPGLEPIAAEKMAIVVDTRMTVGPFEVLGETPAQPGAERCWTETWSPVFDDQGNVVAATVSAFEITEHKRVEEEKEKALRRQTALALLSQQALGELNFDEVMQRAVTVASEVFDVPLTKILMFADSAEQLKLVAGVGWQDGLVGSAYVGIEMESQAGYTLASAMPVVVEDLQSEERFTGPALLHQHGVRAGMSVTIAGVGERPFGVFGIHATELKTFDQADVDILESLATVVTNAARQASALAQRSLLVREMAHRSGNMLQMVNSIAAQTFRTGTDIEGAKRAFGERLASLARANYVISREGWEATRFDVLVQETLLPFKERIAAKGRDILLPPDLSFDMALVLHELATNSAKYGSLARKTGTITLRWRIKRLENSDVFECIWSDSVSERNREAIPPKSGFGSRLIETLILKKWFGSTSVDEDEGFRMSINVPLPQAKPVIAVD